MNSFHTFDIKKFIKREERIYFSHMIIWLAKTFFNLLSSKKKIYPAWLQKLARNASSKRSY